VVVDVVAARGLAGKIPRSIFDTASASFLAFSSLLFSSSSSFSAASSTSVIFPHLVNNEKSHRCQQD